tara:strand:- start:730 stop:1203 length:474 start_codon:yes stop_codon:yes gene_type:complete
MKEVFLGVSRRLWCHISAIIFGFIVVTPITFMALDRGDPVQILSTNVTGNAVPGGTISITWEAIASRPCEGETRAWIVGSNRVIHEYAPRPTVIRSNKWERGKYSVEVTLPINIPPGPAIRTAAVKYFCNPLQRLLDWPITATRNVYFEIGSKPDNA